MKHLSDSQLNEYLDHVLSSSRRRSVELHLETCPTCRVRLAAIEQVVRDLASLADAPLPRDLTSRVLSHLPEPVSTLWTPAFAAQLGAATGAVLFIVGRIIPSVQIPPPSSWPLHELSSLGLGLPAPAFPLLPPNLQSSIFIATLPPLRSFFQTPDLSLPALLLPALPIPLSGFDLALALAATLLFWFVGNAILLRKSPEAGR